MEPDATMTRIGRGIELSQRGERDAARRLFSQLWEEIGGGNGHPLQRCAIAHLMADVQDDVNEELFWDLRALAAAHLVTDEQVAQAGMVNPVAGFCPSLHLNLGKCRRKLGDLDRAREHLERGEATVRRPR